MESDVEEAFIKLLKNGAEVAIAGMDDSQEPSSFSLLYKETVAEDSEFLFTLDAREVDTILENAAQIGFKIYKDCYGPVTD